MFEDARNSYLVFKEDATFTDFSKMGSFVAFNIDDPNKETNPRLYQQVNKPLQALVQGFGNKGIISRDTLILLIICLCRYIGKIRVI